MVGIAAVLALVTASDPMTRLMGWAGFAVYLWARRQKTLFWLHTMIPPFLALFAFVFSNEDPFMVHYSAGTWRHFFLFVGEAGMFITLMTLPFSFFRIDPS